MITFLSIYVLQLHLVFSLSYIHRFEEFHIGEVPTCGKIFVSVLFGSHHIDSTLRSVREGFVWREARVGDIFGLANSKKNVNQINNCHGTIICCQPWEPTRLRFKIWIDICGDIFAVVNISTMHIEQRLLLNNFIMCVK